MAHRRHDAAAHRDMDKYNSKLVVIAGQSETVTLKDVWSLDCTLQPPEWKEEKVIEHSSVQLQRSQHSAIEYKGNIYVFGGQDLNNGASLTKKQSNFVVLIYSQKAKQGRRALRLLRFSNFAHYASRAPWSAVPAV